MGRRVDADDLPGAVHVGELDLVGADESSGHEVDQVVGREVAGEQQFARTPLESAEVHPASLESDPPGLEARLSDRDEEIASADLDDQPDHRRMRRRRPSAR